MSSAKVRPTDQKAHRKSWFIPTGARSVDMILMTQRIANWTYSQPGSRGKGTRLRAPERVSKCYQNELTKITQRGNIHLP